MTEPVKKVFNREELSRFDGKNGVSYVAFRGKVYDVSKSFQWRKGVHQVVHRAGSDLTGRLGQAPHGAEMLDKFTAIGEYIP